MYIGLAIDPFSKNPPNIFLTPLTKPDAALIANKPPATPITILPNGPDKKLTAASIVGPKACAIFKNKGPIFLASGSNAAFNCFTADCIVLSNVAASLPCVAIASCSANLASNCSPDRPFNSSCFCICSANCSVDIPNVAANASWAITFPFKLPIFSLISLACSLAAVSVSPVNAAALNLSKFKSFCKNISASISLAIELSKSKCVLEAAAISSIVVPNLAAVCAALTNPSVPPLILNLTDADELVILSIASAVDIEKPLPSLRACVVPTTLS